MAHRAPRCGRRGTKGLRSAKSTARGNQRRGGVITADGIVAHLHSVQVGVFWKATIHNKGVKKKAVFCFALFFFKLEPHLRERQSCVAFRSRHGIAIMHCTMISAHISSFNFLFLSEHSRRVDKDPDENMHS